MKNSPALRYVTRILKEISFELLKRPRIYKLNARKISAVSNLLVFLNDYPNKEFTQTFTMSSACRFGNDIRYLELNIDGNEIELITGGSVYTEGAGSDSYSSVIYSAVEEEFTYYYIDETYEDCINAWKDSFLQSSRNDLFIETDTHIIDAFELRKTHRDEDYDDCEENSYFESLERMLDRSILHNKLSKDKPPDLRVYKRKRKMPGSDPRMKYPPGDPAAE
jgi:hypothetical protein